MFKRPNGKKCKILVIIAITSAICMSTGCSLAESVALEDESLEITEITTTESTTTMTEITTHIINYTPFITINSLYEPSETTTYIYNPETVTAVSYEYDASIFNEDFTKMTTTVTTDVTTTEETTSETTKITKMFEEPPVTTNNSSIDSYESNVEKSNIDSSYFFKECAFIGDSLTVGLSMYNLIPASTTFAKEGISISGMNSLQLYTDFGYLYPAQAISCWNSKHVYILLGINGVTWISNDTAIENYTKLINSIKTSCPDIEDINVVSVLPVAYSMETIATIEDGRILNSEIDAFNVQLKSMADSLGVCYIDANSYLKNSNGCLPDEITVDGLHLTEQGYERYMDVLLQYVQNK